MTPSPTAAITTHDLDVGYGDVLIQGKVNLAFTRGRITTIIGGSGSGKTSLFRTIVGLIPALAGHVEIEGRRLDEASDKERTEILSHLGMLFQYGALLNSMTVHENVAFPLVEHTRLPVALRDTMVRMRLEQLDVLHAIDLYPSELSGGMKKRVGLARAMIHDPAILMCDEPSAGLDPVTSASLDRLLVDLNRSLGLTVIVVTHELDSIRRISDEVVMVKRGGVHFTGSADAFFGSDDPLIRAFLAREAPPTT